MTGGLRPPRRRLGATGALVLAATAAAVGVKAGACGYLTALAPAALAGGAAPEAIEVPAGFEVEVYARDVPGARTLARGPDGVIFVGTRDAGAVYALTDPDGDGRAAVTTLARGLTAPNGIVWLDGALLVAETSRILRYEGVAEVLAAGGAARLGEPTVLIADLPGEPHHGWRYMRLGPDGWLYLAIGAPCNVCRREDPRFASISRVRPDGTALEVYAHGVRNSVGFDWQPGTDVLWFTDNGRDWLGDDRPPDELNRAPRAGLHFGFPGCHGTTVDDPDHDEPTCATTVAPAAELGAHVAALGMRFDLGSRFPAPWRGGVFIAEHGSWNRTTPVGYRVVFVPIDGARAGTPRPFATGWLSGFVAWGRPVDVLFDEGSLLVSDDKVGAVYRIRATHVAAPRSPSPSSADGA